MAYPSNDNKGAKNLVDFVVHLRDAEDAFGDVVNKAKEDITELINAVQGIDDTSTSKTGVWSSEKVSTEVAASNAAALAAHNAADAAQASANAAQARADKGVADAATAKGVADKAASDLAAEISRAVAAEQAASNAAAVAQRTADACLPLSGGTMTGGVVLTAGDRISCVNNNQYIRFNGSNDYNNGASILLTGKNFQGYNGRWELAAKDEKNNSSILYGYADGRLTLNNVNVLTERNGLPLSGGTMTGGIYWWDKGVMNYVEDNTNNYKYMTIRCGAWGAGSRLELFAPDSENITSGFCISAGNTQLVGRTNASLFWNNKSIETVDSSGPGWIRYTNGLQICFGRTAGTLSENYYYYTYPKPFSNLLGVSAIADLGTGDAGFYMVRLINSPNRNIALYWYNYLAGVVTTNQPLIDYTAFGYWK